MEFNNSNINDNNHRNNNNHLNNNDIINTEERKLREKIIGSRNFNIFLTNMKYEKDMKKIAMLKHIPHVNNTISIMDNYKTYDLKLNNINKKSETEIVIARYSENINWCNNYSNLVTIYNKGHDNIPSNLHTIQLKNVGREAHTYLYHIINNWDNLADITFFGQGSLSSNHDPYPMCIYLLPKHEEITINLYNKGMKLNAHNRIIHNNKYLHNIKNGKMKPAQLDFVSWWYKNIRHPYPGKDKIRWSHGALFSVSKKAIRTNSLNYYKSLIKYLEEHDDPEEGHYFERCWFYIFNCGKINKIS